MVMRIKERECVLLMDKLKAMFPKHALKTLYDMKHAVWTIQVTAHLPFQESDLIIFRREAFKHNAAVIFSHDNGIDTIWIY
jgi:hypothetical protein